MKISLQLSVLLFISTIYFACNSNKQEKDIAQIVTEWQGKEVIFPDDLVFTLFGKDTVDYNIPESNHKILLYVDSVGCTSCKLQLYEWGRLIEEVATLTSGSVPVLLFFHPKDKRELTYLLKRDELSVPVCLDEGDKLNTLNRFPTREDLQCFLLDKDNRVVYIGNPIQNPRIKEMYLSRIAP